MAHYNIVLLTYLLIDETSAANIGRITAQTLKNVELRVNEVIRLEDSIRQLNTMTIVAGAQIGEHVSASSVMFKTASKSSAGGVGVVVSVSDLGSKGPGFDPRAVPKSECMFVNIYHY